MIYEALIKQLKKHFYIVSYEKFKSETSNFYIERFWAKHPLLKPKLIIHNNQPFGFQRAGKNLSSLEEFPIFCEIEYSIEDDLKNIDNFTLSANAYVDFEKNHQKIHKLSTLYAKTISLEKITEFKTNLTNLTVNSNLNDEFEDLLFNFDEKEPEVITINSIDVEKIIDDHFLNFNNFLNELNEVTDHKSNYLAQDSMIRIS